MSTDAIRAAEAAKKLTVAIGAQSWAVTVWPMRSTGGTIDLVVRVNTAYCINRDRIPASFDGYNVRVEPDDPARPLRWGGGFRSSIGHENRCSE